MVKATTNGRSSIVWDISFSRGICLQTGYHESQLFQCMVIKFQLYNCFDMLTALWPGNPSTVASRDRNLNPYDNLQGLLWNILVHGWRECQSPHQKYLPPWFRPVITVLLLMLLLELLKLPLELMLLLLLFVLSLLMLPVLLLVVMIVEALALLQAPTAPRRTSRRWPSSPGTTFNPPTDSLNGG